MQAPWLYNERKPPGEQRKRKCLWRVTGEGKGSESYIYRTEILGSSENIISPHDTEMHEGSM